MIQDSVLNSDDHFGSHLFGNGLYGVATISRLLKLHVSFAKEPYKRDYILQMRFIILRSLLTEATP